MNARCNYLLLKGVQRLLKEDSITLTWLIDIQYRGDDHKPSDSDSEAPLQLLLAAKKGFKGH